MFKCYILSENKQICNVLDLNKWKSSLLLSRLKRSQKQKPKISGFIIYKLYVEFLELNLYNIFLHVFIYLGHFFKYSEKAVQLSINLFSSHTGFSKICSQLLILANLIPITQRKKQFFWRSSAYTVVNTAGPVGMYFMLPFCMSGSLQSKERGL